MRRESVKTVSGLQFFPFHIHFGLIIVGKFILRANKAGSIHVHFQQLENVGVMKVVERNVVEPQHQ